MRTVGALSPSQSSAPPLPWTAALPMKMFAKSSTLDALTRRAAPPIPDALLLSKRDDCIVATACAVTAIAPPASAAAFPVKEES